MMKPIVFLDVDGVARPNTKPNNYLMNVKNVELLNKAFDLLNCDVVISSNWRLTHPVSFFNLHFNNRVIGKTKDLEYKNFQEYLRWYEVLDYMEDHIGRDFYILDDQSYHFPKLVRPLVLCDEAVGFSDHDFDMLMIKVKHNQK